jgi:hypothetical protein
MMNEFRFMLSNNKMLVDCIERFTTVVLTHSLASAVKDTYIRLCINIKDTYACVSVSKIHTPVYRYQRYIRLCINIKDTYACVSVSKIHTPVYEYQRYIRLCISITIQPQAFSSRRGITS